LESARFLLVWLSTVIATVDKLSDSLKGIRNMNDYEWSLVITECLLWAGIALSIIMVLSPFIV
jgi:hypothetical protein